MDTFVRATLKKELTLRYSLLLLTTSTHCHIERKELNNKWDSFHCSTDVAADS